jgi:hypothetical protein
MAGYIGGTFSLISSTARVRYTGTLAEVNQSDGSIILNNGASIKLLYLKREKLLLF